MTDKPNDKALREEQNVTAEDKIIVQLMKTGLSWQESKKLFQEAKDHSPSIQGTNSKSAEETYRELQEKFLRETTNYFNWEYEHNRNAMNTSFVLKPFDVFEWIFNNASQFQVKPQTQEPNRSADDVFYQLDSERAIKWSALSDSGKSSRAVDAMKLFTLPFQQQIEELKEKCEEKENEIQYQIVTVEEKQARIRFLESELAEKEREIEKLKFDSKTSNERYLKMTKDLEDRCKLLMAERKSTPLTELKDRFYSNFGTHGLFRQQPTEPVWKWIEANILHYLTTKSMVDLDELENKIEEILLLDFADLYEEDYNSKVDVGTASIMELITPFLRPSETVSSEAVELLKEASKELSRIGDHHEKDCATIVYGGPCDKCDCINSYSRETRIKLREFLNNPHQQLTTNQLKDK